MPGASGASLGRIGADALELRTSHELQMPYFGILYSIAVMYLPHPSWKGLFGLVSVPSVDTTHTHGIITINPEVLLRCLGEPPLPTLLHAT